MAHFRFEWGYLTAVWEGVSMRFMHAADIHPGYQQYYSQARFDDFGRAFLGLVEQAGVG